MHQTFIRFFFFLSVSYFGPDLIFNESLNVTPEQDICCSEINSQQCDTNARVVCATRTLSSAVRHESEHRLHSFPDVDSSFL